MTMDQLHQEVSTYAPRVAELPQSRHGIPHGHRDVIRMSNRALWDYVSPVADRGAMTLWLSVFSTATQQSRSQRFGFRSNRSNLKAQVKAYSDLRHTKPTYAAWQLSPFQTPVELELVAKSHYLESARQRNTNQTAVEVRPECQSL